MLPNKAVRTASARAKTITMARTRLAPLRSMKSTTGSSKYESTPATASGQSTGAIRLSTWPRPHTRATTRAARTANAKPVRLSQSRRACQGVGAGNFMNGRACNRLIHSALAKFLRFVGGGADKAGSGEHPSELQSPDHILCRLLLLHNKPHVQ